jgi:hypothetical protein
MAGDFMSADEGVDLANDTRLATAYGTVVIV